MNKLYDILNGFIDIHYKIQAMIYVLSKLEAFTDSTTNEETEMIFTFVKYYLEQIEKNMDIRIQDLDSCERKMNS